MFNEKTFNRDENEPMIVFGLDIEMVNSNLMDAVAEDDVEAFTDTRVFGYLPEELPEGLTCEDLSKFSEDPREH